MKKIAHTFIAFIVLLATVIGQESDLVNQEYSLQNVPSEIFSSWMDSVIFQWMDSVSIPGITISVVRADSILYKAGHGYLEVEKIRPVNPDESLFRVASISKVFTATCALHAKTEGKLTLTQNVEDYLSFKTQTRKGQTITLHDLLTHSSGLDESVMGGGTHNREEIPNLGKYLSISMPPQVRDAGTVFSYSNIGYTLAGHVIEKAVGYPFYQYAKDIVFSPLDMKNTHFLRTDLTDAFESKSYVFENGDLKEYIPYELRSYPSGSLLSTAEDMSKFMIMILNNGRFDRKQVLDSLTCDLLTRSVFTQDSRLSGSRSYGFFNWDINGVKFLNHGGSVEGFRSQIYLFPDHRIGMFISSNSTWGGLVNFNIGTEIRKKWFSKKEPQNQVQTSSKIPEKFWDIQGKYHNTRSPLTSLMKIGRITSNPISINFDDQGYLYFNGDSKNKYAEISPLTFGVAVDRPEVFSPIIFNTDKNGNIDYLFSSGFTSFYKLHWWEYSKYHLVYCGIIFMVLLVAIFYWLMQLIFTKKLGIDVSKSFNTTLKFTKSASVLHVICFLVIGFYLWVSDGDVFTFGMPVLLKLLLLLPLFAIGLTTISIFRWKSIYTEPPIHSFSKYVYLIVNLALILIIPFLYYWNLLGFHYQY